jgi:ADP-ribose pyrophosphatase YjhB (NUDIX family)
MKYCSNCAQKVAFRLIEGDNLPRFVCGTCNTVHYQNPKIIVGCLPVFEDKILLCKRGIEPQLGFWNIPGGFMENGETIEAGAFREAYEEAKIKVSNKGLLSVYSVPHINQVHLHFVAKLHEKIWENTVESTDIQLFTEENIPWQDIAFPSNVFSLRAFFENRKTGNWQVRVGSYE